MRKSNNSYCLGGRVGARISEAATAKESGASWSQPRLYGNWWPIEPDTPGMGGADRGCQLRAYLLGGRRASQSGASSERAGAGNHAGLESELPFQNIKGCDCTPVLAIRQYKSKSLPLPPGCESYTIESHSICLFSGYATSKTYSSGVGRAGPLPVRPTQTYTAA